MAARGGVGVELDTSRVPTREPGMTPYEIMLSESQERMLLVAENGREQEVLSVYAKWGLDAVVIGRVTDDGLPPLSAKIDHLHPFGAQEVHQKILEIDSAVITPDCDRIT